MRPQELHKPQKMQPHNTHKPSSNYKNKNLKEEEASVQK